MYFLQTVSSKVKDILSISEENAELTNVDKSVSSSKCFPEIVTKEPLPVTLKPQQGNDIQENSSENENIDSKSSAQTDFKMSANTWDGNIIVSGMKNFAVDISAEDWTSISQKAAESTKSIKHFMHGIADKTNRTLTEVSNQLKTKYEDSTRILMNVFIKEPKEFEASKFSKSRKTFVAPWTGIDDEENVKQQILSLSEKQKNFLRTPPPGFLLEYDSDNMYPLAEFMLKTDPALAKMRYDIVPKVIDETNFWKNYLYRVSLIIQSSRIKNFFHEENCSNDSDFSSERNPTNNEPIDSHSDETLNDETGSDFLQTCRTSPEETDDKIQMLPVTDLPDIDEELEKELRDYEIISKEGRDPKWEKEIEQMLDD